MNRVSMDTLGFGDPPRMSKNRLPKYRRHKEGNRDRAFVDLSGRRVYLGKYNSPESRERFARTVAEWLSAGKQGPAPEKEEITVMELAARFWTWAEAYYRRADGTSTRELGNYKTTLKPLKDLYGETLAKDFGPRAFKAIRDSIIAPKRDEKGREAPGACRHYANQTMNRLKRVFRWGVSEELLSVSVYEALRTVPGLKRGRSEARESEPIRPVTNEHIDAVRPFVSEEVWALIQLQLLTAARSGELLVLRPCDLDQSAEVWTATPREHKTAHLEKARSIYFGPRAQAVIRPFLAGRGPGEFLFSPARAEARRRERMRAARKTPLSCGNSTGTNRESKPERRPRDRYDVMSYGHAIARACKKAKVEHWHPHQLRHTSATHLRREFGLDVARAILGHSSANVTGTYAELDREKAMDVIAKIG